MYDLITCKGLNLANKLELIDDTEFAASLVEKSEFIAVLRQLVQERQAFKETLMAMHDKLDERLNTDSTLHDLNQAYSLAGKTYDDTTPKIIAVRDATIDKVKSIFSDILVEK